MNSKKTWIIVAAFTAIAAMGASWLSTTGPASAQGQLARPASECVTYGSGSALQMCLHTFADGTKCVASGGGGSQGAGAGAALQCSFR